MNNAQISFALSGEDAKELIRELARMEAIRAYASGHKDDDLVYIKELKSLLGEEAHND